MKIKEVIERTQLTDRAIRLYIANDLIRPDCSRSYTGRNNFEFCEADVQMLEKVALLRKAEFSLEQIKLLQQGGEDASRVLENFLNQKVEEVEYSRKVIRALINLTPEETQDFDRICDRLNAEVNRREVPEEDTQPGKYETEEKWIFRVLAIVTLVWNGLLLFGVYLVFRDEFPFTQWHSLWQRFPSYILLAFMVFPIVPAVILLRLYKNKILNKTQRTKRRKKAFIWTALMLFVLIFVQPTAGTGLLFSSPFYSETDNPSDYLILGDATRYHGERIKEVFPDAIPRSAVAEDSSWYPPDKFPETTKYYYFCEKDFDDHFDIFAQWILPTEEYTAEKQRILSLYESKGTYTVQKGAWTCLHFTDSQEDEIKWYYDFLIAAFNDETGMMRYIVSYGQDPAGEWIPYYLGLDW